MRPFLLSTDTASDLPESYLQEHNVLCHTLFYSIDGTVYGKEQKLDSHTFYEMMRNGKMPTTSAINPEDMKTALRPWLEKGYDLLHLAFSSGLSASCQNAVLAANDLKEEFPESRIEVVDTLSASLGEGLVVDKAVRMRDAGKSLDEIRDWVLEHRPNFAHLVTVDDLFHLYRGGRVSKTSAVVGSLVNIKPIIHVNDEGKLIPIAKVRGRKKSITTLVDYMERLTKGVLSENDCVFISHADCEEDAQFLADQVKERLGLQNFLIAPISPTIGSHTGPGCVVLFFYGTARL